MTVSWELRVQEQRREVEGSLRVVYAASISSCRPCPKREQCQWNGNATHKPRRVSVLLYPLAVGSEPLLWHDWSRRIHRRTYMQLLRHQQVMVQVESKASTLAARSTPLLRDESAHTRLSWETRLARNAYLSEERQVTIKLCGVPEHSATSLGLVTA